MNKYSGLTDEEVIKSRKKYGSNVLEKKEKTSIIKEIFKVLKEPTLSFLIVAASIYFALHEYVDGIIMLFCVLFTCGIEFFQGYKTDKALEELNKLADVNVRVIRNGKEILINSEELVVSDIVILTEGDRVPADGIVLEQYGLAINESLLTGESRVVHKTKEVDDINHFKKNVCYKGTDVVNGNGIIKILAIGKNTEYGRIGNKLNSIENRRSSLQEQVNKVVMIYSIFSILLFLGVVIVTFINNMDNDIYTRISSSLIAGITVAIATIPEEIPVILTVFLAMGAMDLTKKKTLTRNIRTTENLGRISVLCTDKTGTITENKMVVKDDYVVNNDFYEAALLTCHKTSYDPVDIAIQKYILEKENLSYDDYENIHEYVFNNKDKMMGIVVKNNDDNMLFVKGAFETIIKMSDIDDDMLKKVKKQVDIFSSQGLRVIAVSGKRNVSVKSKLSDYRLDFLGLITLDDPIRYGIKESIKKCYSAGIRTMLITGDNGKTAMGIAKKIGLKDYDNVITGYELEKMSDNELEEKVKDTNIYARVYPEHKMRIITALQKNGEVVAMTGDGINDATALKKADVGISMGKRGTNVSKEASDIILLDDNFNTIVSAIENGRNIYNNIKKAISYIIAIHIPIALLSLLIPLLKLPTLLLPIHIVLLELLIDPTSSIIFQRIKNDKYIMEKNPRSKNDKIIDGNTLIRCILQGLLISLLVFLVYLYYVKKGDLLLANTMAYVLLVISIMMVANTMKSKKLTIINFMEGFRDKVILGINSLIFIVLLALVYIPFLQEVAKMKEIGIEKWFIIIILTMIGTMPFDIVKNK